MAEACPPMSCGGTSRRRHRPGPGRGHCGTIIVTAIIVAVAGFLFFAAETQGQLEFHLRRSLVHGVIPRPAAAAAAAARVDAGSLQPVSPRGNTRVQARDSSSSRSPRGHCGSHS